MKKNPDYKQKQIKQTKTFKKPISIKKMHRQGTASFSTKTPTILSSRGVGSQIGQMYGMDPLLNPIQSLYFVSQFYSLMHRTFQDHLNRILCSQLGHNIKLSFHQVFKEYRSALFLADEIVYYLKRRVSFGQIKNRILLDIKKGIKGIKGIRIACSGRVGGRSKKAQRAKTVSIKYGQTPLHVWDSPIDFAAKTAHTSFGSIGVKVWVCYNLQ